jgi:hypothetical protein
MSVNTGFTIEPNDMYNYISGFFTNPNIYVIIIVLFIIILFIIIGLSVGKKEPSSYTDTTLYSNNTQSSNNTNSSNSIIFIGFFLIIIIIIWFFHRQIWNMLNIINLDTTATINDITSGNPVIDINVQQPTTTDNSDQDNMPTSLSSQVFNIPGNYYNYEEAQSLCKAYDSRVATYDEIEKTYKQGGEWCNYGWSDGQMALFPTQAETYKNLQKIPGHEHDCGRPGINGGYIANPRVKFGVNCYGKKPKMTEIEEELMENRSPYPLTKEDIRMEEQVEYWKNKINNILISPFNYKNWSKI